MKKDFDFDDVGKHTPYCIPPRFFEDMQQKVMERTGMKRRQSIRRRIVLWSMVAGAAVLAGLLFVPPMLQTTTGRPDSSETLAVETEYTSAGAEDEWIRNLSDEELEELVYFSENDLFLN